MPLQIYNTLTSKKELFETQEPGHARVYVCGPTVYDHTHLGHARCYVVYDVLVRHLKQSGRVTYVRNVTDIDDKIIKRAKEAGEEPRELADRFWRAYSHDMQRLGNLAPDVEPKVSDHLDEIRALIRRLVDTGYAYESDGDVYFSVASASDYGKLSHRKLEELETGASERVDQDELRRKRHPHDFALWKKSRAGESAWPSIYGLGRPGWHIECSAMSMRYLGESFDLHGGGLDLVFPHHENEIAQSECATGKQFARYWVHNGFVQVNREKMSKSLGNFFMLREACEHVEPEAIRYAVLAVHYRAPLNLEWEQDDSGKLLGFPQFEEAEARLEYIYATRQRLAAIPEGRIRDAEEPAPAEITEFAARLAHALDDDLNTPVALAHAASLLKAVNELCDRAQAKKGSVSRAAVAASEAAFDALETRLGIGSQDPAAFSNRVRDRRAIKLGIENAAVEARIRDRAQARADKDFARSDQIRDELAGWGVELLDRPDGTDWRLTRKAP
ncbi:MAG TPA: cysteine--tRNA ligase [Polyangiaceae bacterium]